jgi:uncharacterized membrane protein YvlD (DUF360 family)
MVSIPYVLPHWVLHWAILSVAFWLTSKVVSGFRIAGLWDAVWVAAIFSVIDVLFGWLLYVVFGIGTLGIGFIFGIITRWFVYATLLKITDGLTSRLQVQSFGTALVAALLISLLGRAGVYITNHALLHSPTPAGSIYL